MEEKESIQNFFVGKTSPFLLFDKAYHSLYYVVENKIDNHRFSEENNPACEVALIGILAYFEAFCKHQFAAIINIFPELAIKFSEKRRNLQIDLFSVISYQENTFRNLGFILAEKYDFGSALSINGNFRDLIAITPFSKERTIIFDEIVYKRNLLVHHGGYYTLQSLSNARVDIREHKTKAFKDNVKIEPSIYLEHADFLFEMALHITENTIDAIKELELYKSLDEESLQVKAVDQLGVGLYDKIS